MAPTGKAASNVCGSKLHSHKEGLALQLTEAYKKLQRKSLAYLQKKYFNKLEIIFIDEWPMISQKTFYHFDQRCREITCIDEPFGNLKVVMFGDPGQLPPVKGNSLWFSKSKKLEDIFGYCLYQQFIDVVILEENNRLNKSDSDAVLFEEFLSRLRDGENTKSDFNILREKCSYFYMGHEKWKEKGFENDNVIHIFNTNKEVLAHNNKKLLNLRNKIALIECINTGNGASMNDDKFGGLHSTMFLCVGAKVVLTRNFLNLGLSNGSTGIVKEIFYDTNRPAPQLPKFVFVDFGVQYTGRSFFPSNDTRKGWFPIYPVENKCYSPNTKLNCLDENNEKVFNESSRIMLPLKLCWAWTA